MSGRNLNDWERQALRDLLQLMEERAAAHQGCKDQYENAKVEANRDATRARKTIAADRERERQAISTAWEEARRSIQEKHRQEQAAADKLRDFTINESKQRARTEEDKTQTSYADALWTADSLHEAAEKQAKEQIDILKRKAAAATEAIESAWNEAAPFLQRGRVSREEVHSAAPAALAFGEPLDRMEGAIGQAADAIATLQNQRSLRWVGLKGYLVWFVLFGLFAAVLPVLMPDDAPLLIIGGVVFAALGSAAVHATVRSRARRRCRETAVVLAAALAHAAQSRDELVRWAAAAFKAAIADAARAREGQKVKAMETFPPILAQIANRVRAETAAAEDKHERDVEKLRTWQYESLQKAESHFDPLLRQSIARHDASLVEAEKQFEQRKEAAKQQRNVQWSELSRKWREGQDGLIDVVNHLRAAQKQYFLPWDAPFWKEFPPIEEYPKGIQFGTIAIDLEKLPGGIPEAEDLALTIPAKMDLPVFLPFPERCTLVLKARDAGRDKAVQHLQAVMLRFLTAVPGGKVRFSVIDPVGLGDNFAAFMHLADYDENLIGARIWTETAQIEKRLADLTAHMENVIQKYLRNQYKSIEEYNAQAGEVAEPFRVLVVANFPANFNLDAARRLASIVQSGATCGVYTLISIDARLPVPQGFNVADLENESVTLVWKDNAFQWKDPDFAPFPLTLSQPPPPDEIVRLVRIVGERGRNANRVEVPFDSVMPKPDAIWKSDTRKGISVPIGRSGATKQQLFQLGQGTAQHGLVAGKTGSGKSTLLHALITNLALHFSPDEVELYLIDFKKGVEFKPYAEHSLPHARVVAIESEREFGLSVLQRLDVELRQRGERFRDAGVNDVAGYRAYLDKNPGNGQPAKCPRIMLIVDEFQEFFVEDDRIAQETALLLDRLVRQGRAFGLHLLLGSQTLGGAYSLARSTIDQMAVRIALQCSDADAQLILNKDNTAARLLSRPGEAIYNDANGLAEGNDLFQVVYLSDSRREQLLEQIHKKSDERGAYPPPLVFEGNIAAELSNNHLLAKLLEAQAWPADVRAAPAWLGDAIAIKDPTAAVFRPHSGNHLLVVGQNEESALAMFAAAMLSLAAQHDPATRFVVLDSTLEDDPNSGFLGRVAGALPHHVDFVARNQLGEHLGQLGALVAARQKGELTDRSPHYLIIHGLQRYRDLRKEDDFGFGKRGAERVVSPAEHFANILREGPAAGLHVLVWCDALTNLGRAVDRQLLREFGMKVIFQMNANDSSTLIDNPVASRLGRNRALFLTEEMSQPEKFRPYGLPSAEWLKDTKHRLLRRQALPAEQPVS